MKSNNLPDYPKITLADLSQLTVDAQAARRFERRFYPGLLGGAALAFVGMAGSAALHHSEIVDDAVFSAAFIGSFVFGVALGLLSHHWMMRAVPRNPESGRQMLPFIIQDLEAPDHYELAYVDRTSGTYFRRIYV